MDFESFALTARLWASRAVSFCLARRQPADAFVGGCPPRSRASKPARSGARRRLGLGLDRRPAGGRPLATRAAPLASDAGRPALDGATRLGRRPARLGRRHSPRTPAGSPWTAPLASGAGRPASDGATRLGRRPARLGRRRSPRTPATRLEKFPDSHQIGTRKSIRTGRGAKSSFGPLADADSSRDGPVWLLIIDFPRCHQVRGARIHRPTLPRVALV